MPVATVESLQKKAAALKKKLAEKGGKMDATAIRKVKRKIRRAQRRRRKMTVAAARASKPSEAKSE